MLSLKHRSVIDLDPAIHFLEKQGVFHEMSDFFFLVSYEMSDYFFSYHFLRDFLISFPSPFTTPMQWCLAAQSLQVPLMHKNFSYPKRILSPGSGCFLGRSVLLVELIRCPLCLGLFLCLQAHVGMKHMQENVFIKAWFHHSIIAGSIDARKIVK